MYPFQKDLYTNLEASSVNTSPDISNQQNIIKQKDALQKLKTSLYTNLNDSYKATQTNLLEARDNLVNKVAMAKIAEHELSNTNTNLSVMKNIRNDKLRMAEINNYYSSKYDTQTTVMKTIIYFCIPILILGILVKKSAFAIGFLFVWSIIEGISKGILKFEVFPEGKTADTILQFFPLESMGNLIVEPFSRLSVIKNIQTAIGGAGNGKDYSVHFTSILIVLAWTAIFIFLSYKLLKKRDL